MPQNGKPRQGVQGCWSLLLGILVIVSCFGSAQGEWISVGNNASDEAVNFNVLNSNQFGTDFTMSVNGLWSEPIPINGESYTILSIPEQSNTFEVGKPNLPKVVKLVAIPATGNVELLVESGEVRIIEGVKIPPVQEDELWDIANQGRSLYFDDACWQQSVFYPDKLAEISEPMLAGDLRVVAVAMYPIHYNPVTQQLKIYTDLSVSVTSTGGAGINEKRTPPRRPSSAMMSFYRSEVLNIDYEELDDPNPIPGTLLIICANDASVLTEVNTIANWKRKKGINAVVATKSQTGSTSTSIYNYILAMYNNSSQDPPLEFVMLVGDSAGALGVAPHTYIPNSTESDYGYSLLAGSDYIAEIAVGRLSFATITDLQVIRKKILKYESDPYMGGTNPDWFEDAWMYAGISSGITSTIHVMQYSRQALLNIGYNNVEVSTHNGHVDEQTIRNHLDAGIGIWNHRPDWIGEIYCTDVDQLNNGWMMPVCLNLSCGTGNWVSSTSISECLLRAGTVTQPQGAIAAVSTATSGTHTAYNNSFTGSFFHSFADMHQYFVGYTLSLGKAHFLLQWPGDSYASNFCQWNNLMGDPTLEVWTSTPATMTAIYPSTISVGTNVVTVTVRDGASQLLSGAYVHAYKSGQTFIGEVTGTTGTVTLPIAATTVDTLFITVSKHDYKSVCGYALVQNSTRNVAPVALVIDDNSTGYSHGNNNGIANPGEGLELSVTLKNWGSSASNSVSATMSCSDPRVTSFGNTTVSYGNISAGGQVTPAGKFELTLASTVPDTYNIELTLTITDNTPATYTSVVVLNVKEANFEYVSRTWVNAGNGILDGGETANLSVTLRNQGHTDAPTGTIGTLSVNHPLITILDATGTWTAIAQGATGSNSTDYFQLRADSSLFNGTPFRVTLYLQNGGLRDTVTFNDTLGTRVLTDPLGPDAYGYYAFDNGDTYYSKHPFYSWVEIDSAYGGTGGNALAIADYSESQDASVLVTLPFSVQYYGRNFTNLSVCSNGYIAFGDQTSNAYAQNWTIPGALGAFSQVSAFWDDFSLTSSGSGRVWKKTDTANHRFIIEWSRVHNVGSGATETFEIIIYQESYYPTPTNDAEILVLYNAVTNGDYGDHYASVGIDNFDQTVGIQYTYNNQYATGAAQLTNGRAILFTTNPGELVDPPNIDVEPTSITSYAVPGDSIQSVMYISNTGESNLDYSIYVMYDALRDQGNSPFDFRQIPVAARMPLEELPRVDYTGHDNKSLISIDITDQTEGLGGEIDNHGGPDSYGYSWIDSDEPGGPVYSWVEITSIGVMTGIVNDDQNIGPFNLGFTMNYYGTNYTSARLCSNGWLSFTSTSSAYSNVGIPNNSDPNDMIAPFWDDLYPPYSGRVYYYQDVINHRFIVQWDTIANITGSGRYTFEAILNVDGSIIFQYQNIYNGTSGYSSTTGIENSSGTVGLQVAYDQTYVHNNLAVRFYLPNRWLAATPLSGTVEPSRVDTVRLGMDAGDLEIGTYLADINITNSDPNNSLVVVPVTFVVTGTPLPPAAVDDLVIGRLLNHVTLAWQPITQNTSGEPITVSSYKIYCSDDPHFIPSPSNQIGTTGGTSYLHVNAIRSYNHRFYRVVAVQ